jgi:hypothetical protein
MNNKNSVCIKELALKEEVIQTLNDEVTTLR